MYSNRIGLTDAFNAGWNAFTKYPWIAIGGFAVYAVITWVGSAIPVLNVFFTIFATFPLIGGLMILTVNIARDNNPTIGDLFKGFSDYWKWMGVGWLLTLLYVLCFLPVGILAAVASPIIVKLNAAGDAGPQIAAAVAMTVILGAILAIAAIYITIRWAFALYFAVDGASPMEAIRSSAEMTDGWRLQVLGIFIVISLVGMAGLIALGIGYLATAAFAMCVYAAMYVAVTRSDEIQTTHNPMHYEPEGPSLP